MNTNEKVQLALEEIENGLANISTDKDWLQFLKFQSLFYNYSFGNTMLIYLQNPEASYVKGYQSWKKLGRFVRKGEKGIYILAPCLVKAKKQNEEQENDEQENEDEEVPAKKLYGFRLAYVYDISSTDGNDEEIPVLVKGLSGNSTTEKEIYNRLLAFVSDKYEVQEVSATSSKGSYNIETNVISIREDLKYLQKIKTLLHEYAHAIDFSLNPSDDISRNKRELIAESVAYIVCSSLSLDTSEYSFSYLNTWQKKNDEIKDVADTIQKVAAKILNSLSAESTVSVS